MAIDISKIKGKLNKLQNSSNRASNLWKPSPGKTQVRIVPYKFRPENPFIELYFHYNINKKTYLSPQSFGRPDPIVEFAEKLKRMGDRDDWKAAKKMEPKLRTFVPVVVRGEEDQGVRFWGFGKTVYQDLLGYIADPDYGDITDPHTGRDITVEYQTADEAGTQYPVTTIRVKPNVTPLVEDEEKLQSLLDNQKEITDVYSELSYDELKEVLEGWLNPTSDEEEEDESVSGNELSNKSNSNSSGGSSTSTKTVPNDEVDKEKLDNVASAFDDLFNG